MVRDRQDIKSLRTAAPNKYIDVYYYQATTGYSCTPVRSRSLAGCEFESQSLHPSSPPSFPLPHHHTPQYRRPEILAKMDYSLFGVCRAQSGLLSSCPSVGNEQRLLTEDDDDDDDGW